MASQVNVKPIDEQNFLNCLALGALAGGFLFIFVFIVNFFEQSISTKPILGLMILWFGVFLIITVIFTVFKSIKLGSKVKKETTRYGNFQDEYLNHVNMNGYKYAYNFTAIYLFIIFMVTSSDNPWSIDFITEISIRDFSTLTIGLISLSYAIPVFHMLKGADDE